MHSMLIAAFLSVVASAAAAQSTPDNDPAFSGPGNCDPYDQLKCTAGTIYDWTRCTCGPKLDKNGGTKPLDDPYPPPGPSERLLRLQQMGDTLFNNYEQECRSGIPTQQAAENCAVAWAEIMRFEVCLEGWTPRMQEDFRTFAAWTQQSRLALPTQDYWGVCP